MQQQGDWYALGQALKGLRTTRDFKQKEVIDRSGERMGERTLRAYEKGEQCPSRDRLLRLLIRSFEVKNLAELNRHLRMVGYAVLNDGDAEKLGLHSAAPRVDRDGHTTPLGFPADFRIEVSTLIVTDGQGREIWRHQFPTRLAESAYEQAGAIKKCTFVDIDGDGGLETLFVCWPINFGSVGATLICFAEDGTIKWQFVPGKTIRDTRQEYRPPYFISNVQPVPVPQLSLRILVSSNHYLHNPNQIAMLDTSGRLVSEYWHSGHLLSVVHTDLNGDGVEEILLAGVNNGYRQATMVIFDPRYVSGASSQPGRQIFGFPTGTEKTIVLFPKTCLAKNAPYNRAIDLRVTVGGRIMLVVAEGVSESENPGLMIYELDFGLNVISARPDSHFQESHRVFEEKGLLDHSWTEEEVEQLRRDVIVKGRL